MEQQLDTFDDGDYTDGPMDGVVDEGEGQGTEEETVQADQREEVDSDSQVSLLDETEDTGREEEPAEKEAPSDKSDEEAKSGDEKSEDTPAPKDDDGEDVGEAAEPVRLIKAFNDGKQYDIPETAEIKTKVDGKWEKPTLQELKDNYSGVVAHDRKFSELDGRVKDFESKEKTHMDEIGVITDHFKNIRRLTDTGMAGEGDILGGMNYLLDLMGINTVDYNKAVFNSMAEELDLYNDLTEGERDAHWTKKENAYLVKKQESLQERQTREQSQADLSGKVNSLREAHGISEEDYVSAEEDLKSTGMENLSPENIVRAAQLTPLLESADTLIEPYLDQLSDVEADDLSVEIATTLLNTPEMTIDQVKRLLAENYEVESIVSDITKKTGENMETMPKTAKIKEGNAYESFDDWD